MVKPVPADKIMDCTKLKASADDKPNVDGMIELFLSEKGGISLIAWIVFNPAFITFISVISQRQLTLFMSFLSFTIARLGL